MTAVEVETDNEENRDNCCCCCSSDDDDDSGSNDDSGSDEEGNEEEEEEDYYYEGDEEQPGAAAVEVSEHRRSPIARYFSLVKKYYKTFQRSVKALVEHKYFQQALLGAILINTLSMGIEYHNQVCVCIALSSFFPPFSFIISGLRNSTKKGIGIRHFIFFLAVKKRV